VPKNGSSPRADRSRRYYEKHRERILAERAAEVESGSRAKKQAALRVRKREHIAKLKAEATCPDCKQHYPAPAMDFDHVRGQKVRAISGMVSGGYGWDALLEEIAKCEIVCANCHRIRTAARLAA
jgi:hypothetical protein